MSTMDEARLVRDRLLATYRQRSREYAALLERGTDTTLQAALLAESERVLARYERALPRVAYAMCPFDNVPLIRSFDPFGLDGPWWAPNGGPREPRSCRHFCVVRGAVRFGALPPHGGAATVYPGPEVPYVLPRLLDLPGMVAVIGTLPMDHGLEAFVISYFAERRPSGEQLAAGWRETHHEWTTQLGETGFRIENDLWDFELAPWIARGKLRWCVPGSGNLELAPVGQACPYLALSGRRVYQVVQGETVSILGLPDGTFLDPFAP